MGVIMESKAEFLKQQIECRYFQPCFACRMLCGGILGNELFETQYQGVKLKAKLEEMQGLQPGRQSVYDELEKILPADEFYEFLILIDAGFDLLAWDIWAREEVQWGDEFDRLVKDMRSVLRKNKRLGGPIKIQIQNPYMIDARFKWSAKLPPGGQRKPFEKMLIKKMIRHLISQVTSEKTSFIVHDVFKYFFGSKRSMDGLQRRDIREVKKRLGHKS